VNKLAESANAVVRIYTVNQEKDAAAAMLAENNADAIFGDSLKLMQHLEANPGQLQLSKRGGAPDPWYSRVYVGFAVPRNDLDFRLLVEYTLQEFVRDGTWKALAAPVMPADDPPPVDIWPGTTDYLGFKLGS
jgi:ABC-type amino acid transport substrate-binding protein